MALHSARVGMTTGAAVAVGVGGLVGTGVSVSVGTITGAWVGVLVGRKVAVGVLEGSVTLVAVRVALGLMGAVTAGFGVRV